MDKFDLTNGDFLHNVGGGMMMDTQGHLMQDMGSGMALDLESGELHLTSGNAKSSFDNDEDDW